MSVDVERLIDHATALAKQRGDAKVTVAHLALVLALDDRPEPVPSEQRAALAEAATRRLAECPKGDVPELDEAVVVLRSRRPRFELLVGELGSALGVVVDISKPEPAPAEAAPFDRPGPLDVGALVAHLRSVVLGQDEAVDRVARRLALTRVELDLRPERPDGVFLFVGPTGVGKTALALALSEHLFGSAALVRLDMSEYGEPWSVARLIGPQPGYVGYDEPASWLTTKILETPRAVLLLDEIEKAHPAVWNTFLQVFDAGHLTDAKGRRASFRQVIVVMTSNLGARSFDGANVGFRQEEVADEEGAAGVLRAVERTMAPELVNRLDEVVVFRPLDDADIADIARKEIAHAVGRCAAAGYDIAVDDDVASFVASTGYDRRYGARHVQRNVERLLLSPLAPLPRGTYRAMVTSRADPPLEWIPTPPA